MRTSLVFWGEKNLKKVLLTSSTPGKNGIKKGWAQNYASGESFLFFLNEFSSKGFSAILSYWSFVVICTGTDWTCGKHKEC